MELSGLPEKILSETTGDRSRDPSTCSAAIWSLLVHLNIFLQTIFLSIIKHFSLKNVILQFPSNPVIRVWYPLHLNINASSFICVSSYSLNSPYKIHLQRYQNHLSSQQQAHTFVTVSKELQRTRKKQCNRRVNAMLRQWWWQWRRSWFVPQQPFIFIHFFFLLTDRWTLKQLHST
jgi:hypothetical protein